MRGNSSRVTALLLALLLVPTVGPSASAGEADDGARGKSVEDSPADAKQAARPAATEKQKQSAETDTLNIDGEVASAPPVAVDPKALALTAGAPVGSPLTPPVAEIAGTSATSKTPSYALPQAAGERLRGGLVDIYMMVEYRRDEMKFTGEPTLAFQFPSPVPPFSVPDAPIHFVPTAFDPNHEVLTGYISARVRDYGFERLRFNTQVSFRYTGDIDGTTEATPFQGIHESFVGRRIFEPLTFYTDISGFVTDDRQLSFNVRAGRQAVYGAQTMRLDGATVSFRHPRVEVDVFGGRRVTFYSDPEERTVIGHNLLVRPGERTTVRYDFMHYIDGAHYFQVRQGVSEAWLLDGGLYMVDDSPVDLTFNAFYLPFDGMTRMSINFLQKVTSDDFIYDQTFRAIARNPENQFSPRFFPIPPTGEVINGNARLNLLEINPYTQVFFDVYRNLSQWFGVGGSVWVRQVNDGDKAGPFDTSFQEYRASADYFPTSALEVSGEYRFRNLSRRDPKRAESFDDIRNEGDTRFHELYGNAAYNMFNNRLSLEGGLFYRRFDTQSRNISLDGIDTVGITAGVKWRISRNYKLLLEYGIDDELSVFNPDIDYTQSFRARFEWRFNR